MCGSNNVITRPRGFPCQINAPIMIIWWRNILLMEIDTISNDKGAVWCVRHFSPNNSPCAVLNVKVVIRSLWISNLYATHITDINVIDALLPNLNVNLSDSNETEQKHLPEERVTSLYLWLYFLQNKNLFSKHIILFTRPCSVWFVTTWIRYMSAKKYVTLLATY